MRGYALRAPISPADAVAGVRVSDTLDNERTSGAAGQRLGWVVVVACPRDPRLSDPARRGVPPSPGEFGPYVRIHLYRTERTIALGHSLCLSDEILERLRQLLAVRDE